MVEDLSLKGTERRFRRLSIPPCTRCAAEEVKVVSRTPYVVYVRCGACGHVWSLPKPGLPDVEKTPPTTSVEISPRLTGSAEPAGPVRRSLPPRVLTLAGGPRRARPQARPASNAGTM